MDIVKIPATNILIVMGRALNLMSFVKVLMNCPSFKRVVSTTADNLVTYLLFCQFLGCTQHLLFCYVAIIVSMLKLALLL